MYTHIYVDTHRGCIMASNANSLDRYGTGKPYCNSNYLGLRNGGLQKTPESLITRFSKPFCRGAPTLAETYADARVPTT